MELCIIKNEWKRLIFVYQREKKAVAFGCCCCSNEKCCSLWVQAKNMQIILFTAAFRFCLSRTCNHPSRWLNLGHFHSRLMCSCHPFHQTVSAGRCVHAPLSGACFSAGIELVWCGTINADFRLIIGITVAVAVGNVSPFFRECCAHGEIIIEKCRRGRLIDMVNQYQRRSCDRTEWSNVHVYRATKPIDWSELKWLKNIIISRVII